MNRKNADDARRLGADPAGRAIEEAQQSIAAKLAAQEDAEQAAPVDWPRIIKDRERELKQVGEKAHAYRELLGSIWLYVDWRYVTRQLTTEQKELWADAVESTGDPDEQIIADRWWRDDAALAAPRASQAATAANGPGDDHGAGAGQDKPAAANSGARVYYEVEAYNDGFSVPIHQTDWLDDARDFEGLPEWQTRIVRVTREVVDQ